LLGGVFASRRHGNTLRERTMSKYGQAAVNAVLLYTSGQATSPRGAWKEATAQLFGAGSEGQRKACPRDAFLGLCEENLIPGIPSAKYTRSKLNKEYALTAVGMLRTEPDLSQEDAAALWRRVQSDQEKAHNQQMDVVLSLWNGGYIRENKG